MIEQGLTPLYCLSSATTTVGTLNPQLHFVGRSVKQHNMAKVYSGLYEVNGHVVPYLVVNKCGKPSEKAHPGNRGKRDSQMMLMHFLNKVSDTIG